MRAAVSTVCSSLASRPLNRPTIPYFLQDRWKPGVMIRRLTCCWFDHLMPKSPHDGDVVYPPHVPAASICLSWFDWYVIWQISNYNCLKMSVCTHLTRLISRHLRVLRLDSSFDVSVVSLNWPNWNSSTDRIRFFKLICIILTDSSLVKFAQ